MSLAEALLAGGWVCRAMSNSSLRRVIASLHIAVALGPRSTEFTFLFHTWQLAVELPPEYGSETLRQLPGVGVTARVL